jgi:hypothetical protein
MADDFSNPPQLFIREGDRIIRASTEDEATALRYSSFPQKGPVNHGYRITILTKELACTIGEVVRVIHILEAVEAGTYLYIMGPKPVRGEHVDGVLVTLPSTEEHNPPMPSGYDGRVVEGPGVDYNYEITQYRFDVPGTHLIQWDLGRLVSNMLEVHVHGALESL